MSETTTTTTPRCGHDTSTGPCARPQGHPKTGHRSAASIKARTKGPNLTVDEMTAKEAERAKAAKDRIKAARAAEAAKVQKLREQADALGFVLTPKPVETETEDA